MGFRIIRITSRCKLETQLNYLVCRTDKETRVPLDEIDLLVIESQQAVITEALITALLDHKVKILLCDEKHHPQGEINAYSVCYDSPDKLKKQVEWTQEKKDRLWQQIVKQKIHNQAAVLQRHHEREAFQMLSKWEEEVLPGDPTNREGLSAKTYFPAVFGEGFVRQRHGGGYNDMLDYGYSVLLALVDRAIAIYGYNSSFGIHHRGKQNVYNLGSDLMEPMRPFVDDYILSNDLAPDDYKHDLLQAFGQNVDFNGRHEIFQNAIFDYVLSCLQALSPDDGLLSKPINFLAL